MTVTSNTTPPYESSIYNYMPTCFLLLYRMSLRHLGGLQNSARGLISVNMISDYQFNNELAGVPIYLNLG